jgi:HSP20 family protein
MRSGLQTREWDDFFNRFVEPGPKWPTGGFDVPTDVFSTDDKLVIRMDLPDVKSEDVEVTVQESTLVINGTRRFPYEGKDLRFLRRGTFYGDFAQRVQLGKGLDVEKINARYENGVLELTIPYAEEVQPRKIAIEVGSQAALSGRSA